ncbi:MAG: hypothetical protein SPL03_10205 [Succinivibrio dextrinosolvens]|nr:hypothetical protein [Succinivibrio dextrinosolvens]
MSDLTTKETKYLIKLSCAEIEDIIIQLGEGRDVDNPDKSYFKTLDKIISNIQKQSEAQGAKLFSPTDKTRKTN